MHSDSRSGTTGNLIPIWERVLAKSHVGPEDNFFSLGGDASSAACLFSEIARLYGRELPPWVIYRAPTVRRLAAMLDAPTPLLPMPLVELKPGSDVLPVFMAHGMGGDVLELFELVKHLQTSRAIYGLQARGRDGGQPALTRIEQMAHLHVEVIKAVQPHGPYRLVGYSLGGLVALEMARLLAAQRQSVALLVMIDSYVCTNRPGIWERARQLATQLEYCMSDIVRPLFRGSAPVRLVRAGERTRFSEFLAWTRYRPRPYDGEIRFVRAADSNYPDPATIWPRFVPRLRVEILPGDHHTVLSDHSESLARLLSSYLENAPQA